MKGTALRREKGFTLIELLIVVVILGFLSAMAGPSISGYIDKRKIINAAEAVYSQLQFARSQSISRSAEVHVKFDYADDSDKSTWLMSVSTHEDCDLDEASPDADYTDDCTLVVSDGDADEDSGDGTVDVDDLVYHITSGADFNGVVIDANNTGTGGAPNEITFNPTRGTAENESIFLWYDRGGGESYLMRVTVGMIGRVRICTPDSTQAVPGYSPC